MSLIHPTPAEADVLRTGHRDANNRLRALANCSQGYQRTQPSHLILFMRAVSRIEGRFGIKHRSK